MKWIMGLVALLVALAGGSALAQSGGTFDLSWNSVDGGGIALSQGGTFTLGGTIGQADAGALGGGTFTLTGGFQGAAKPVGVSALAPTAGASAVDVPATFTLTWTHPERWRDLDSLDLRLRDEQGVVLWARFTESTDESGADSSTFSLLDAVGNVVGTGAPGSPVVLESETAVLYLEQSVFRAAGPDDPVVAVDFTVSFKGPAAGRVFDVEVIGSDDLGNVQGPEQFGTWQVGDVATWQLFLPVVRR